MVVSFFRTFPLKALLPKTKGLELLTFLVYYRIVSGFFLGVFSQRVVFYLGPGEIASVFRSKNFKVERRGWLREVVVEKDFGWRFKPSHTCAVL